VGGEGRGGGDKGGRLPARGQPGYCGESILSNYTQAQFFLRIWQIRCIGFQLLTFSLQSEEKNLVCEMKNSFFVILQVLAQFYSKAFLQVYVNCFLHHTALHSVFFMHMLASK
jgi:hypothetical protein